MKRIGFYLIACVSANLVAGCASDSARDEFLAREKESEAFAKDSIVRVASKWEGSAIFRMYSRKLGPLKKIDYLKREKFSQSGDEYIGLYKAKVTCELSPAVIMVGTVCKKDHGCKLSGFDVDAEPIKNFNHFDIEHAQDFVNEKVPTLCAQQSRLGKLKSLSEINPTGMELIDGAYVYGYEFEARFEKGTAHGDIGVVKNDDKWDVRTFKLNQPVLPEARNKP